MKRKNTTRNALLTSIISLLLCVSMLVGTTFAWFTDSVESGINTITAGNLDVKLYHSDKNDSGYVSANTELFNDVSKWEPGVVVYENFKVENVGDLALKYRLSIKFENETKVTVDGVEHGLSEVLKVGVVKGGFSGDRSKAQNIPFDKSLSTFDLTGVLEGNTTSETYGIVIYWAPNANETDNIFNMNNENKSKTLSIDLGVDLFATQEMYENDSFGDDYDDGLILPDLGADTILVEKDGIQYYYDEDGNHVLYKVTENFTGDTVNIPEGVDAIGDYAFTSSTNVKTVTVPSTVKDLGRAFDSSAVEKVVIAEGLETISSRAFKATSALTEVVIPSTVTVIEDNAFQKSGIKEIVIPATVETIGETAFGASLIEKVTFMGNTSIQGFAFRGCTKLHEVVMYGDDVTFIPSTLNGRNSTWFCNSESNNPNTSDIDFYVANATVAARVKTAMGAEANNTDVYIMGEDSNAPYVTVTSADELQEALESNSGNIALNLAAGSYKLSSAMQGRTVIISGTEDAKIDLTDGAGMTNMAGANITFEGVTVYSGPQDPGYNTGIAHASYVTYNNCVIDGTLGLQASCEFNKCTFTVAGNYYNAWTWGAATAKFTGCTFNCDGKALLVYGSNAIVSGEQHQDVEITGCTFNDNGDDTVTGKAAIEITNTYAGSSLVTYDIVINGITVNGFSVTSPKSYDFNESYGSVDSADIGTNVWGNKCQLSSEQVNIVIDGVDVY